MTFKKLKTDYGRVRYLDTKEASFNIETILPKKRTPAFYLKKSYGYLIVIEGTLNSLRGKIKEKEVVRIKPKQKFWMENKTNKKVRFLAIDIPLTKESDIVWIK